MSNYRIMIVDDEEGILDLISQTLSMKYEVVQATNGLDALEKLERAQPDFIILDVMMPLMDGFDTCRAIKKNPDYNRTPIYFLTSSSDRDHVKKAYELGCDLYLQKPFDPIRLLKNIDFYIEQQGLTVRPKKHSIDEFEKLEKEPVKKVSTQAETPSVKTPSPVQKTSVRTMIIDDNPETLSLVKATLEKVPSDRWNFNVIPTDNPVDALSSIVRYQPDLILLDIKMPKLDGLNLCKIIKLNKNLKDLGIVFITGISDQKQIKYAEHLSRNPVIRKPFDAKDMLKTIDQVCNNLDISPSSKKMSYDEVEKDIAKEKVSEKGNRDNSRN